MHPMIRVSLDCVRQASRRILSQYDRQEALTDVRSIDLLSQQIIQEGLSERYPYLQFIGEESAAQDPTSEWLCIIDPLDGSTNYYHKIPMFAVSIAFARYHQRLGHHQLEFAMIYEPLSDRLCYAERGRGAFMNQRRLRLHNNGSFMKQQKLSSLLLLEVNDALIQRLLDLSHQRFHTRKIGSIAVSSAMVAQGQAQACVIGKANIWDIAAGTLLIQEAGGLIVSLESEEFNWMEPTAFVAGQAGLSGWIKHQLNA